MLCNKSRLFSHTYASLRVYPLTENRITVNPHAPYTVSDADLVRLNEMSEVLGLQYHIHLHETAMEVEHSRQGTSADTHTLVYMSVNPETFESCILR